MNPENILPVFYEDYCKKHTGQFLSCICLDQLCADYLNLQCKKCHYEEVQEQPLADNKGYRKNSCNKHTHKHCKSLDNYLNQKLYPQTLKRLTKSIRNKLHMLQERVNKIFEGIIRQVEEDWYKCLGDSCTKKQCIFILENPSKIKIIEETAAIKDQLIGIQFQLLIHKVEKEVEKINTKISKCTADLIYKDAPDKWKFDSQRCHSLLNLSPHCRSIDKKSQTPKFCMCLLNQPLNPNKNEITLSINNQNIYDKCVMIGLCNLERASQNDFEIRSMCHDDSLPSTKLDSKLAINPESNGIYAIYQASNIKASSNALSLHSSDASMNYKETVGWNFGIGDSVTIGYQILPPLQINQQKSYAKKDAKRKGKIWFRKNKMKEKFEFYINLYEGLLYPFVALYAAGDKISVEGI